MTSKLITAVKARIEAENTIVLTKEENPKQRHFVFVEDGKVLVNATIEDAPATAELFENDGYTEKDGESAFVFRKVEKEEVRNTINMIEAYEDGTAGSLMTREETDAYNRLLLIASLFKCGFNTIKNWAFEILGTESVCLIGKGDLFTKLHAHAKKLLEKMESQHVVFGVNRDGKGHLRTFFVPMTDRELWEHEARTSGYIHAVHA